MIGRGLDLNGAEHYKSQAFPDYEDVIFEEFVSQKDKYIPNEPYELLQLISTIARNRKIRVWMVANTVSRVCPYFSQWGLKNYLKQKIGTIDVYHFNIKDEDGKAGTIDISLERCVGAEEAPKMFWGKMYNSIQGGDFETRDYPKHPLRTGAEKLYDVRLHDLGFSFVMELKCTREGGFFIFVHPETEGKQYDIERVIQSDFSPDPLTTPRFSDTIKAEVIMRDCLKNNKVCYSDNLTGMDFEAVIKNREGGPL